MRIRRLLFVVGLVASAGCNLLTGASSLVAGDEPSPPDDLDTGVPIVTDTGSPVPVDGGTDAPPDVRPTDARTDGDGEGGVVVGRKRVFVTKAQTNGDMNGLLQGDQTCATAALTASLGGSWVAWLSIQNETEAIDRLTDNGPWYLVDRTTLAVASKLQLAGNGITHAIDKDEGGGAVPDDAVWTGTRQGKFFQFDCNGWNTATAGNGGTIGRTSSNGADWTGTSATACTQSHRLYCFEN